MEINDHLGGIYTTTSLYISCEEKMMSLFADMIGNNRKKHKCLGLILMFGAGIFLTLGNSLFQFIEMEAPAHISSSEMLIIRCVVQLLFSIAFMVYGNVHIYGRWKKNVIPLIAMGITEVCVIIFMYEAIERMPVGDATVLQFTAPVFTAFLSFVFIKTQLRLFDAVFGIISFVGVVFIAKPDLVFPTKISIVKVLHTTGYNYNTSAVNNTISHRTIVYNLHYLEGAMFAIASAFSLSLFFILNKINGMKLDVILTIFYPSAMGILIGPIVMLIRKEHFFINAIKGEYWGILIFIGFTSFIGLMLLGESLQLQNPGPAILIRNCDIVFVYILQYLLMHIVPTPSAGIGTFMILGCSSLIALNHSFNLDKKCCGERCGEEELNDEIDEEAQFMLLNNNEDEQAVNN